MELLELRLGLTHLPASQTSRAVVYRGLLEHLANQQPTFFGGSLKVDAVGVSNELLGWRDELILAGWDPRVEVDSSRIKQLAEVEASAKGSIPMGIGDRLARILTELAVGQAGIDRLSVREPEALLPVLWVHVLKGLGARFGVAPEATFAASHPARDLERLASALAGVEVLGSAGRIQGDDSLQIWEAFSETTLARAVAQYVRKALDDGLSVAVVADGGTVLGDAWRAEGLPSPGIRTRSQAFPIPQLLGLCLEGGMDRDATFSGVWRGPFGRGQSLPASRSLGWLPRHAGRRVVLPALQTSRGGGF